MPLRKIAEVNDTWECKCYDPEHNPPTMIVLEPGTYEHTCPSCRQATIINIPGIRIIK